MDVFKKGDPDMRKMLFALTALAALALLAPNTIVAQGANNQVGIYTTETPDLADLTASARGDFPAGQFTIYAVVTNPYNVILDQPITNLGGFEFRIEWPAAWFITAVVHPSATNFQTPPDFLCGSNRPVVGGQCTVISVECGTFDTNPEFFYLTPISDPIKQTIKGGIALTDYDDNFSLAQMYTASGDFAQPVFGFHADVVPNEDESWGGVKALFR